MRNRSSRTLLALLYIGPLLLWMGVIFVSSTSAGDYPTSMRLIQHSLNWLVPEQPPLDVSTLYKVNNAARKLAHVVTYGILTLLVVRAVQFGQPRLKRGAFGAAFLVSLLYAIGDEWHRRFVPQRHAKFVDLVIDSVGITLTLGGTWFWFALKDWERRLAAFAAPAPRAISTPDEPQTDAVTGVQDEPILPDDNAGEPVTQIAGQPLHVSHHAPNLAPSAPPTPQPPDAP